MAITHRSKSNMTVQSLTFINKRGDTETITVVESGIHNLGYATQCEKITVISGELRTKKGIFKPGSIIELTYNHDEPIEFEAPTTTAYISRFC